MRDSEDRALRNRAGGALGAARQQEILSLIARGEIIAVNALSERFGVSQETVRRDIRALEEAGLLQRVHGGAMPTGTVDLAARRPVMERLGLGREAKQAAAQAALPLFRDGMHVFLGGSSTMLLLAELLAKRNHALTVTTNMVDIATVLAGNSACEVSLLGGILKPATHTLTGVETIRALERRVFDLAVCGASAFDPVHGILGPSAWHAEIGDTLGRQARRLAYVIDASKFGRSDAHVVRPVTEIHAIATNKEPDATCRSGCEAAGIMLLVAAAEAAEQAVEGASPA
ncbi:DeoR/GlpR family DNA-binding transcription regulator [Bosea caraganae]|nr:DeoR/GlpR family DNA-binding transcription regulator [Bosea caraganae]